MIYLKLFSIFSYYFRHSISKNQYQYLTPCNVEDNRRANNWSFTQSFYDNKHNAKHSYNNNSHLKIINEVSMRRIDFLKFICCMSILINCINL